MITIFIIFITYFIHDYEFVIHVRGYFDSFSPYYMPCVSPYDNGIGTGLLNTVYVEKLLFVLGIDRVPLNTTLFYVSAYPSMPYAHSSTCQTL